MPATKLMKSETLAIIPDIARQRLLNQKLSSTDLKKPSDLVEWLGAVQAQDYHGAKWALGQRFHSATDATVEKAFNDGRILRTHVMRPTWHFVSPLDIRWMLNLTAPRVNAALASYYRKYELDRTVFRRSNKALVTALKGGKQLTREVLRNVVERAGISAQGLRFLFILARAELDALICSGPRIGKQFTYALIEERAPRAKVLSRDEALAELTRRYFTSHGPATLEDFSWWSGLTPADTRAGISMVRRNFVQQVLAGKTYWLSPSGPAARRMSYDAHLLPTYDEYLIGYKDRSAALESTLPKQAKASNPVFSSPIVIEGRVVGSWKRMFKKDSVIIALRSFRRFSRAERRAVVDAAHHYGEFLGMKVLITAV
jgi:hypothetical protein